MPMIIPLLHRMVLLTADERAVGPCASLAAFMSVELLVASTVARATQIDVPFLLWHTSVAYNQAHYDPLHAHFPCILGLCPPRKHDKMGGWPPAEGLQRWDIIPRIVIPFENELAQIVIQGTYQRCYEQ